MTPAGISPEERERQLSREIFDRLRTIAYLVIVASVLIIISGVLLNVYQAAHTTQLVQRVDTFLDRGDCRSRNQADINVALSRVVADATPRGERADLPAAVTALRAAAVRYEECTPAGTAGR